MLIAATLALAFACATGPVRAADFDAGVTAFQAGDYDAARRNWAPLADAGQPQAQFNLALLYANGLGVARAPDEARRWFQAAAEQGNAQAQYNLALMLQLGDGIARDIVAARRWYEAAARQGLASAQNNLGLMYLEGQGMPADRVRALRWLERAAADSTEARNNLDGLTARLPGARVTASRVNLRAGPSIQSRILDQVKPGDRARLLDQRRGWSQLWIVDRNKIGWIADRLLDIDDSRAPAVAPDAVEAPAKPQVLDMVPDDEAEADPGEAVDAGGQSEGAPDRGDSSPPARWYKVATASAELRAEASGDARVLERLSYGAGVEVLERRPGWRRVRVSDGGRQGWIGAFVLTPDAEAEARAAAAAKARRRAAAVGSGGG